MAIDRSAIPKIHKRFIEELKKIDPSFSKHEGKISSNLEKHYILLLDYVVEKNPSGNLYQSSLLIQGLLTRSLNLFLGILRELSNHNVLVVDTLLREYLETVAVTFYTSMKPDYLEIALIGEGKDQVNILTMIDHLDKKKHKGTRADYDLLSEVLHPNTKSHFLCCKPIDKGERVFIISTHPQISTKEFDDYLKYINTWVEKFFEELKELDKLTPKE